MSSFIITTTYGRMSMHQFFWAVAYALADRGHQVVILVPDQRDDLVDPQGNPAIYTWPSPRPTRWQDARFLYRLARQYDTDLILGNFGATNLSLLIGWAARIPVRVPWYHTMDGNHQLDYPQPAWKTSLLQERRRFVYRFATRFLTYTEASKRDLVKTHGVAQDSVTAIFPVVPDPLDEIEPGLRKPNKIICLARLNWSKGQDILLQALPAVKRACPSVEVEFVGDGPIRDELVQLASALDVADICTFTGTLYRSDVLAQLATSALAVVPSRREAFGFVNVEALGVGTPIVASDADGIPAVVPDGQAGLIAHSESPDDFSDKIIRLMKDQELRERLGRNAREHFVNTFAKQHIGRFVEWFEDAAMDG